VHLGDDVLNDCSAAKSCGARTVWLDAAAPSWAENAYSTMSAADREKRRLAAEAVDVAVAVDRTIRGLAELPDAVDGALS
jgi:FMN phosphatase YigB (HAD superfamily)